MAKASPGGGIVLRRTVLAGRKNIGKPQFEEQAAIWRRITPHRLLKPYNQRCFTRQGMAGTSSGPRLQPLRRRYILASENSVSRERTTVNDLSSRVHPSLSLKEELIRLIRAKPVTAAVC